MSYENPMKKVQARNLEKVLSWGIKNPLGSKTLCAQELGLSRATIYNLLAQHKKQANDEQK